MKKLMTSEPDRDRLMLNILSPFNIKTMNYSLNEQSERITLIGNIQLMQAYVFGTSDKFATIDKNSTDELRDIQERLIPDYNKAVAAKKQKDKEAKEGIAKLCASLLEDAAPYIEKMIEKAINSSAIDVSKWSMDHNPMILPKSILIAALNATADQYKAGGTSFDREMKITIKNLSYIL